MQDVYEQFFFLKYSGGWSFSEAYNLPVGLRIWFVKRLIKQLEAEREAAEKAQKTATKGSSSSQTLNQFNQPPPPRGMGGPPQKR